MTALCWYVRAGVVPDPAESRVHPAVDPRPLRPPALDPPAATVRSVQCGAGRTLPHHPGQDCPAGPLHGQRPPRVTEAAVGPRGARAQLEIKSIK